MHVFFWVPQIVGFLPDLLGPTRVEFLALVAMKAKRLDEGLQFGPELIDGRFGIIVIVDFEIGDIGRRGCLDRGSRCRCIGGTGRGRGKQRILLSVLAFAG